jgi:uncharacterized protein YjbI with pentapeptide repeats
MYFILYSFFFHLGKELRMSNMRLIIQFILELRDFYYYICMQKITPNNFKEILQLDDISNMHFIGIDLSGQSLSRKNFISCRFEKCNLSNIILKDTTLNDVSFQSCKILWAKFSEISQMLSHFNFYDCIVMLCSFFGLTLKGIGFEDCEIQESDFTNALLENAKFSYCDLEKSTFVWCNLKNADFIGSYNFIIDPVFNKFSKTKFSRENCIWLLQNLDIIIE